MLTAELPGTGGRIRERPEDFGVEEIPAYLPCGEGSHTYARIEKQGVTTDDVVRQLARLLDLSPSGIGFAGRKDKYAVTTQWFSVPAVEPERLAALEADSFRVLEVSRHGNKLRTGHLRGNKFRVTIRGVVPDAGERAEAIIAQIVRQGLPNSFGEQRFGAGGDNADQALAWITGEGRKPRNKGKARLLVSALQSQLFNEVVRQRLERGLLTRALPGDVMKLSTTGGMFLGQDPEELAPRLESGEISPTGPIFGARMWWPEGEALALEEEVLAQAGLTRDHLERFRREGQGSRRVLRVFPQDLTLEAEEGALVVSFVLESGSYATTLLAEIMKES